MVAFVTPITRMHSIEIDDDVMADLSRRAVGFHVTPNDVLRKVLGLPSSTQPPTPPAVPATPAGPGQAEDPLQKFVASSAFQAQRQSINRFLLLLWWAHAQNQEEFQRVVTDYSRGNRRYFGRSQEEVEASGVGIKAKQIPKTPFWVLSTLDNKSKRMIIEDVFRAMGLPAGSIALAREQLADSDISRRRNLALQYLN